MSGAALMAKCCCASACCTGGVPCATLEDGATPGNLALVGSITFASEMLSTASVAASDAQTITESTQSIPQSLSADCGTLEADDGVSDGYVLFEETGVSLGGGVTRDRLILLRTSWHAGGVSILIDAAVTYKVAGVLARDAGASLAISISHVDGETPCVINAIAYITATRPSGSDVIARLDAVPDVTIDTVAACSKSVAVSFNLRAYGIDLGDLGEFGEIVFQGDFELRQPDISACVKGAVTDACTGACCVDGVCSSMTREDCEAADGGWIGGATCADIHCDPFGALPSCCLDPKPCWNDGTVDVDWEWEVTLTRRVCHLVAGIPTVVECVDVTLSDFGTDAVAASNCASVVWGSDLTPIGFPSWSCGVAGSPSDLPDQGDISIDGEFRAGGSGYPGSAATPLAILNLNVGVVSYRIVAAACSEIAGVRSFDLITGDTCGGTTYSQLSASIYARAIARGRGTC